MTVALIGLPGSGKSTVGRHLARKLGLPFTDSDHVIEQRVACSISMYFEREGEAAFRDLESQVIDELTRDTDRVLSTGGGSVLRVANRMHLRNRCRVIYLRSTPEELFRRLKRDTSRPLLQVQDPMAKLRELFDARDPLYRETAHFSIDTGRPSVATLVNMIAMQLDLSDGLGGPSPRP